MDKNELLARLQSIEWDDIEFKEATWAVPKDALSTVSAFANTEGGHLVFGVKQAGNTFTVTGVLDADKMQNDFLGQVRDTRKVSIRLPIKGDVHELPEGTVLAFYIPEALRHEKPVFLDGDPKKAHIRRGGRDDTCTPDELMRFIRDSDLGSYDAKALDLDITQCFDSPTVHWYRERFAASNPGRDAAASDEAFLRDWGFIVEHSGVLHPTRAAILTFGSGRYVRQELPRIAVDLQFYRGTSAEYDSGTRWADRVPVEDNLIKAWQAVVDFYFRHSERPFAVDATTMRRADDPPDYVSFREAAINLLIHQDFGDTKRVPVIRFFRDQTEFFNPGDAFATRDQLLNPGDKEVRNPYIVNAFRRIGLSDQGGTGVRAIFDGWRKLGYLPPEIENDKAEKSFRLRLCKEKLVTEEQLLAQGMIGVHLSDAEANVFAYLTRKGRIDLTDVKALTGLSGTDSRKLVDRLVAQVLLVPLAEGGTEFALAEHLRARMGQGTVEYVQIKQEDTISASGTSDDSQTTAQATEQAGAGQPELVHQLVQLSAVQRQIVGFADVPRSVTELTTHTGHKQRAYFKKQHLDPLLDGGIVRMTEPEKPTSPNQRYVLTDVGIKLKLLHEQTGDPTDEDHGH